MTNHSPIMRWYYDISPMDLHISSVSICRAQ